MNYYLDTEFLEGPQKKRFFGIPYGNTPNTIDLISIGIVSEEEPLVNNKGEQTKYQSAREYYAISKDFNLKEAWNRFQKKTGIGEHFLHANPKGWIKEYWIRENVLKPIWRELYIKENDFGNLNNLLGWLDREDTNNESYYFTYKSLKKLLNKYGKTNKQIANEIVEFIYGEDGNLDGLSPLQVAQKYEPNSHINKPVFYAYYADYDWVVFCWLFGRMIDLPKGFPMYCNDLQQIAFNKARDIVSDFCFGETPMLKEKMIKRSIECQLKSFDTFPNYPKQNESKKHSAIEDARWDKEFHEFLESL